MYLIKCDCAEKRWWKNVWNRKSVGFFRGRRWRWRLPLVLDFYEVSDPWHPLQDKPRWFLILFSSWSVVIVLSSTINEPRRLRDCVVSRLKHNNIMLVRSETMRLFFIIVSLPANTSSSNNNNNNNDIWFCFVFGQMTLFAENCIRLVDCDENKK